MSIVVTDRAKKRAAAKRREKTVQRAVKHFTDRMPGRFQGRANAIDRIRRAKLPGYEAKRLVAHYERQGVNLEGATEADAPVDHSDAQEIKATLLRRDKFLDQPQAMMLARMDKMIAAGNIDRETFNAMASRVIKMKCQAARNIR